MTDYPPAITPDEAASVTWDAVVVGAGPAGAVSAARIAARGARTLLVDRAAPPRPKVCGGCLGAGAIRSLRASGLGGAVREGGASPFSSLRVTNGSHAASIPLPEGRVVRRDRFDAALARAAIREGASLLTGASVRACPLRDGRREIHARTRAEAFTLRTRCVVLAAGLGAAGVAADELGPISARSASRIGLGAIVADATGAYEPGVIHMGVGRHAYAGVARLDDATLDVAAAVNHDAIRAHASPGDALAALLEAAGLPAIDALAGARLKGTPRLTQRPRRVAAERLLLVGDAAGYVEPFTGEGMAWAITGGTGVAEHALRAAAGDSHASRAWTRWHARHVARRQRACRVIAGLLARPALVAPALALLGRAPAIAAPVTRRLHTPGAPA